MVQCVSQDDRWQCSVTNGEAVIGADTPKIGGGETGFRPHEFLEAALATCLNISIRMEAESRGISLGRVTTDVDLQRTPERTVFSYTLEFEGITESEADSLRDSISGSPVQETLSKPLGFEAVDSSTE